ncbi:MAG: hypothetical protein KF841_05055 [Phycisphaerae bacterium]|nr:hypothetical protein [Phycisphaerae bacterium]
MKAKRFHPRKLVLVAIVPILAGCDTTPIPVPEAVLEGQWQLIKASDPDGNNRIVIELNQLGTVTSVTNFLGGVSFKQTNASGKATLTGDNLLLRTSTNLKFEASFNAGFTEAIGRQFTEISFLGIITTIDEGEATLTRVP